MIQLIILIGLGIFSISHAAYAVVLWNIPNLDSPTMVPAYQGQSSPFPQPKKAEASENPDDETVRLAQRARQAKEKAQRAVATSSALQINRNQLVVKGVTDGVAGIKVLIQDSWIGLNQTFIVRYAIEPVVAETLSELRELDQLAAESLQRKLDERRMNLEKQGVKIVSVNIKNKQITLETPQGRQQLPLVLMP